MSGISTGGYMANGAEIGRPQDPPCVQQLIDGVTTPIFTPETPLDQDLSHTIELAPGRTICFDVWNMPSNRVIYINRVVVGSFQPLTCDNSNRYAMRFFRGRGAEVLYRKRMDLGNPEYWKLTSERTQLITAVPGTYQLELESTDMLGQLMRVDFTIWPTMDSMPKEYWGGVL